MACRPAPDRNHPRNGGLRATCQSGARTGRGWGSTPAIVFLSPILLNLILTYAAGAEQDQGTSGRREPPVALAVTQLPVGADSEKRPADCAGTLRVPYGSGARILLRDSRDSARLVAPGFHSAADPDVSFDGRSILFAGKRTASDRWTIYEAAIGSGEIRQITRQRGDCRSPCYQGPMYTITENAPWRQITFVGIEAGVLNECGTAAASAIYSCKLDGSFVQRLTYNLSSDYDPVVMPDGRLLFAAWQRAGWDHGLTGRIALLGINTDGIDLAPFCGSVGRRIKHMPCITTSGLAVFVEADTVPWDGAGVLACVTLRRPLHSYRQITDASDGLFHSPSPLPDGRILVSRRPADGTAPHAVYCMDPISKRLEPVLHDPRFHCIQARAVAPRAEPDGRSSVLTPEDPLGKFYCLDVYQTDFKDPTWLPRGTAKKLRVLEGIPRTAAGAGTPSSRSDSLSVPQLALRRILGEVPLAADGSFNIEVPANLPIQLQLLDERGLALRSCGWIWTRNHESQGCIGCHEDPELTPANRVADAVAVDSVPLRPPVQQRQTVGFRRDVMPIIAKKCADCHGPEGSPPRLDGGPIPETSEVSKTSEVSARNVYGALLARETDSIPETSEVSKTSEVCGSSERAPRWKYVEPGRARTSPLVWHLFGVNTSRPWDGPAATRPVKPIPPEKAQPLSAEEKALLVRWVDLGAPWESVLASTSSSAGRAEGGKP